MVSGRSGARQEVQELVEVVDEADGPVALEANRRSPRGTSATPDGLRREAASRRRQCGPDRRPGSRRSVPPATAVHEPGEDSPKSATSGWRKSRCGRRRCRVRRAPRPTTEPLPSLQLAPRRPAFACSQPKTTPSSDAGCVPGPVYHAARGTARTSSILLQTRPTAGACAQPPQHTQLRPHPRHELRAHPLVNWAAWMSYTPAAR